MMGFGLLVLQLCMANGKKGITIAVYKNKDCSETPEIQMNVVNIDDGCLNLEAEGKMVSRKNKCSNGMIEESTYLGHGCTGDALRKVEVTRGLMATMLKGQCAYAEHLQTALQASDSLEASWALPNCEEGASLLQTGFKKDGMTIAAYKNGECSGEPIVQMNVVSIEDGCLNLEAEGKQISRKNEKNCNGMIEESTYSGHGCAGAALGKLEVTSDLMEMMVHGECAYAEHLNSALKLSGSSGELEAWARPEARSECGEASVLQTGLKKDGATLAIFNNDDCSGTPVVQMDVVGEHEGCLDLRFQGKEYSRKHTCDGETLVEHSYSGHGCKGMTMGEIEITNDLAKRMLAGECAYAADTETAMKASGGLSWAIPNCPA